MFGKKDWRQSEVSMASLGKLPEVASRGAAGCDDLPPTMVVDAVSVGASANQAVLPVPQGNGVVMLLPSLWRFLCSWTLP